jgi:LPS-assembly lipoprotein
MSWSRRALILSAVALAGCGYAPVYGPAGAAGALRGAVLAEAPVTDFGFDFVRRVEGRLGLPDAPAWALAWAVDTQEEALAIDGTNAITRLNLEGRLAWTLTPIGAEAPVRQGTERAFTAWSATGSTISTLESERDARARLAVILADAVVARLLADPPPVVP